MDDLTDEQLSPDSFDRASSLTEMMYLAVCGAWRQIILERADGSIPTRAADEISFSALLLAVEHGGRLTDKALRDTRESRGVASHSGSSWLDERLWELCEAGISTGFQNGSGAISQVTVNLDHHASSIRWWHLEVGWFIRNWLDSSEAIPRLLENLATALRGPFESAGLAAAVIGSANEFFTEAEDFEPADPRFTSQYRSRLKTARDIGTIALSAHFYRLESLARMIISTAAFSLDVQSNSFLDDARDAVVSLAQTRSA